MNSASDKKSNLALRSGGRVLVDALKIHGIDLAFSVAGESFLDVLDAFVDVPEIKLVTCRQEGGASFMAEVIGKLTGKPGIAFVTRGPGACNASIGVHTAFQDSTPMILFIGQVARDQAEREAFQEIDFRRMFAGVAKWAAQIDDAARIPEFVGRAVHVAISGRPGPVVLALPEDMLRDKVAVPDPQPTAPTQAAPGSADLSRLADMLGAADRPIVLVGGGWSDAASEALGRFAAKWNAPVCCSFRRQDTLDNRTPQYCGDLGTTLNPALVKRIQQADLVLALGARLGEITTQGYELFEVPQPRQSLIHVHASAEELGRVFHPDLAIQSGIQAMAEVLGSLAPPSSVSRWASWTASARQDYLGWLKPAPYAGAFDPGAAFIWLRERLPDDAIVTIDAGNFSGWAQRFLQYRRPGRQLGPTNGAMGYGVPAAVAASIRYPDRLVVCNVGDGGFLMTGQELSTAMQARATPIILLFNNGMYGTIRMHQERRYPGRVSGTALANPDFVALARSYGAFAAKVERTDQFAPAFEEAVKARRASILELQLDPELITTRTTLSAIRAAALSSG